MQLYDSNVFCGFSNIFLGRALQIEKEEEEASGGLAVFDGAGISLAVADEAYATGGIFGDAETKSFYEDLPDLLTLVPLSVLGLTPEQAAALREEWSKKQQQSEEAPAPSAAELTGAEDQAAMADDTLDLAGTVFFSVLCCGVCCISTLMNASL